ncbi:unnamed protein product [Chironomus riparius]|uniref:Uncharacterized protein n=1 Tax=Chironomus riparius TaxID=315576 RepID=A0A9N9S8P4_9DIPT|nr:unnamed protein product [Chironomus riparius]
MFSIFLDVQILLMLFAIIDRTSSFIMKPSIANKNEDIKGCTTSFKELKSKELAVNYCEKTTDLSLDSFTSYLTENSSYFIITIELNILNENLKTRLKKVIHEKVPHPVILIIYSRSDKKKQYYVKDSRKPKKYKQDYIENFINEIESFDSKINDFEFQVFHSNTLNDAIKNDCDFCIRIAMLKDERFLIYSKLNNIEENYDLTCNSYCFKALLDLPYNFNFNESHAGLYNSSFKNYIDEIREAAKEAILKTQYHVEINFKFDEITALAWKEAEYQIFEFLIRNDFPYPKNFLQSRKNGFNNEIKTNQYVQNLENYIIAIEAFHRDIKDGNLDKVEQFIASDRHLVFARNLDNKSALKTASDIDNDETFAYIKSNGLSFATYQELDDYFQPLKFIPMEDDRKFKIFYFNRKFSTSIIENDSVKKLLHKSKYIYDHHIHTQKDIEDCIEQAYIKINQTFPDLLTVVSYSTDVEIIFDFINSDIIDLIPTYKSLGVTFYEIKIIVIGAKNLLINSQIKSNKALGTVAELIARVPSILLTNRHNQVYIENVKTTFKDLFLFYYNYVLPDMQDYIQQIDTKEKVKELNIWLDLIAQLKADKSIDVNATDVSDIKSYLNEKFKKDYKIFTKFNSKSVILKLYYELEQSKNIAVFMPISFLQRENFELFMYKIFTFPVDVSLILHSSTKVDVKVLIKKFGLSTLRKIFVIQEIPELINQIESTERATTTEVNLTTESLMSTHATTATIETENPDLTENTELTEPTTELTMLTEPAHEPDHEADQATDQFKVTRFWK